MARKLPFAVKMVPSILNSITACDLLIAAICARSSLLSVAGIGVGMGVRRIGV